MSVLVIFRYTLVSSDPSLPVIHLGQRYKTNFRRKISEALFIKETKPDLNVQKESYKLLLFN